MMEVSPTHPRKTGAEWKDYALRKLHPELGRMASGEALLVPTEDGTGSRMATGFDLPREVADTATQSEYGTTKEATSATIVTRADIRELIPLPQDAELNRCTAASLRRAEKDATDLLHHIQREITQQLQEAGVSYATSTLDSLESAGQVGEKLAPRAKFAPRRQLEYHGGGSEAKEKNMALDAAAAADLQTSHHPDNYYWRYVEQQGSMKTHSENFSKRAQAMDLVRRTAEKRHLLYDDIENGLRSQAAELNMRLTGANEMLAISQENDHQERVVRHGHGGQPETAPLPPSGGVPTHLTGMLPGIHRMAAQAKGSSALTGVSHLTAPSYSGGTFVDDYMKTGGLGLGYPGGNGGGIPAAASPVDHVPTYSSASASTGYDGFFSAGNDARPLGGMEDGGRGLSEGGGYSGDLDASSNPYSNLPSRGVNPSFSASDGGGGGGVHSLTAAIPGLGTNPSYPELGSGSAHSLQGTAGN